MIPPDRPDPGRGTEGQPPVDEAASEDPLDRYEAEKDQLVDDPLRFDDPAARERQQRRLERERRRRERQERQRRSGRRLALGKRVKGASDGQPPAAPPPPTERPRTEVQPAPPSKPPPSSTEAPAAAPAEPRPSPFRRPPSGAVRRRRIFALAALAVLGALAWFLVALFQPFAGDGEGEVVVEIPKGASADDVADLLDEEGVVSSGALFRLRLTLAGASDEIQAGTYTLANGMSYSSAIDELTKSPSVRTITVVIPEGYSRDQIDQLASDAGLEGDYKKASANPEGFDPTEYGAPRSAGLEGFLFPATYELKPGSTAEDLVDQQLAAFEENIRQVDRGYAKSKNLDVYDVLTIGSMIDREVQVPEERKLVSAVIYNRLSAGEPLGIDATIRYATDNFDKPLTESELAIDSPYNTRLVAGLPPTPIGNPGLESIEAAAKPAKVDYRFYVVKPGTCGEHVFTASEAEFEQAADRYQRALEAEGGSPTEC
jgi:UPF0755 protein